MKFLLLQGFAHVEGEVLSDPMDDLQVCLVVISKVYELVTAEALDVISPGEHVINHGGGEGRAWGRCCLGGGCSSTFLSPYPEELEPDPHLVDS